MNMKPQKISENVTLFSADPIVYVVSDFLSDAECNAFIEFGKDKMERARVISDSDHEFHKDRTNSYAWAPHDAK